MTAKEIFDIWYKHDGLEPSVRAELERIKDDWDDRKYAEIERDCLLPLWQLCRRMQETEQDIYAFIFGTEHELAHIDTDIYS